MSFFFFKNLYLLEIQTENFTDEIISAICFTVIMGDGGVLSKLQDGCMGS